MADENFMQLVEKIVQRDLRYRPGAYEFVSDAVTYTIRTLQRENLSREKRHVSGGELIRGVVRYAESQFGPLAWEVLSDWGITTGPAIGDVVFNMIEVGLLTAGKKDSREDFNEIKSLKPLFRKDDSSRSSRKRRRPPVIA